MSGERQNLLGRSMLTELKLDWGNMMHVRKLDPVHSQKIAEYPDILVKVSETR